MLLADGQPVRHAYVLSEEAVPLAGAVVARDELQGDGAAANRTVSCASATACSGLYPNDTWSGNAGDVHAAPLHGRRGHGAAGARPEPHHAVRRPCGQAGGA